MSATTVGFGMFVGIAIGPGLGGTSFATSPMMVEIPAPAPAADEGSGSDSSVNLGGTVASTAAPPPLASLPPATLPPVAVPPPATTTTPDQPPPDDEPPATKPQHHHHEEPPPTGASIEGTVLHLNPAASSYDVATTEGQLFAVHSKDLPDAGTNVSAPVEQLGNRTFNETAARTDKKAATAASFSGVVTFVDAETGDYTVSGGGASVLIHPPGLAKAASAAPVVGDNVNVKVTIAPSKEPPAAGEPPACPPPAGPVAPPAVPKRDVRRAHRAWHSEHRRRHKADAPVQSTLTQTSLDDTGASFGSLLLEGVVDATCTDPSSILLSADDTAESALDLDIASPDDIDLTQVSTAKPAVVLATLGDDGTFTLDGIASDDGAKAADDPDEAQGDFQG